MSKHNIGCILDHGCRNDVELSKAIIQFAQVHGFQPEGEWLLRILATSTRTYDVGDVLAMFHTSPTSTTSDEAAQLVSEVSDEAIDYLNNLDLPPYTYYGNDGDAGAFGLWADVEQVSNDSMAWTDLKVRGHEVIQVHDAGDVPYVAHVNDHGNVTLYKVELTEVWSVV
jgi:hypothetical protein